MADFMTSVLLLIVIYLWCRMALFYRVVEQIVETTTVSLKTIIEYITKKLKQFYFYIKSIIFRRKYTMIEYNQYQDICTELQLIVEA